MKIEKVNDTQIRCTLTKEDLAERQLKLSELAYGTEKAKSLFREMMQQAAYEFGFEADNIPLMIEAIPLSGEAIILIITKVEYPEELDSRFSQFSPPSEEDEPQETDSITKPLLEGAEEILNLLSKAKEKNTNNKADNSVENHIMGALPEAVSSGLEKLISAVEAKNSKAAPADDVKKTSSDLVKMMIFDSLDDVSLAAALIGDYYNGKNDLYLNSKDQTYYLVLHRSNHTADEFNRVCNTLSEYAKQGKYSKATEAYFKEHGACILAAQALQILNTL